MVAAARSRVYIAGAGVLGRSTNWEITTTMAHHEHEQPHHGHQQHGHPTHKRRAFHRDWRTWLVVLLMLGTMAIYLLTMDESIQPGNSVPGQPMPAAPAPPAAP